MAKRFSKVDTKSDLLSEITALYTQYIAENKLKKLRKTLPKDESDDIIKL